MHDEKNQKQTQKIKKISTLYIIENRNKLFFEETNPLFHANMLFQKQYVQGSVKHTHEEFKPVARFDGIFKMIDLNFIEFKLTDNISVNILCGGKKEKRYCNSCTR